jgi:hypothetical protein
MDVFDVEILARSTAKNDNRRFDVVWKRHATVVAAKVSNPWAARANEFAACDLYGCGIYG